MKAVVIGGGITGLCSAWYLRKSGWDVTVLERSDLKDNCSYGNLGMIVPSHFVPLAAPGIVLQGIKWMFNSSSPFYIKPSLNPELLSWAWRFMRSANQSNVDHAAPYLRDLNVYSKQLYEAMALEPGFDFGLERKGILMYFKTQKVAEEEVHLGEKARRMGLDVEALDPAAIRALEPGLDLDVLGAVHYRCDAHLYPNRLMPQLIEALGRAGVQFVTGSPVIRMERQGSKIKAVHTPTGPYVADRFVLTGGSWLPGLAALAGVTSPCCRGRATPLPWTSRSSC